MPFGMCASSRLQCIYSPSLLLFAMIQVTRIALELLDILGYLGSRRPPVIHR